MHNLLAILLALLAAPLGAQTAVAPDPVERVALIEGWREPDGRHLAAVEIDLAPGWHTYWRSPGAAGIPPQFDWSNSVNLSRVEYEWPQPIVFDTYGSPTIGYKGALILPVRLTPRDPAQPIDADLVLYFGVCKDICIPAQARIDAVLHADAPPVGEDSIRTALASRAIDARAGGVTGADCRLGQGRKGPQVHARITFDAPLSPGAVTVIEAPDRPDLWIGTARTVASGRTLDATARLKQSTSGGVLLARDGLRITVLGGRNAVEILGCDFARP